MLLSMLPQHGCVKLPFLTSIPVTRSYQSILALIFCLPTSILAAEDPPDKSGYHLFNPTPRELMRELNTDRPDQTESPYTVDAGHFLGEMDIVKAVFDRERAAGTDLSTTHWNIAPINLKLGLANNVDIQFIFELYNHSRNKDRILNIAGQTSGFGEMLTRLKINLWGNEGGTTALAIMPYVKWPLAKSSQRNGKIEGGVIIPLAIALPYDWNLGLMTEFDFVRNTDNKGYETEFFNTITLGHDIIGDLAGYLELVGVASSTPGIKWRGQVDLGFTYALNDDTQFDLGCNFGVTKSAPDFNPFMGLSWRY